MQTGKKDENRL